MRSTDWHEKAHSVSMHLNSDARLASRSINSEMALLFMSALGSQRFRLMTSTLGG